MNPSPTTIVLIDLRAGHAAHDIADRHKLPASEVRSIIARLRRDGIIGADLRLAPEKAT